MDLGSSDKSFVETEDQQRDNGSPPGGKLDLGRATRKGEGYDPESEAWHDSLQEDYLNQREYQGSPMLPYDVSDVGINSHIVMSESKTREEPCSQIQSGLYHDDMGMRISNSEGRRSPSQVRGFPGQSDVVDCSASDELHLPVQNEKLHTEIETEDSALYLEKCSVAVNRKHPQENLENEDSSHQSQELPVHDESVNEHHSHILGSTKSEEADIFHQEKDVGNANRPNEIKEDIYDSGKPPFDNEEDVHGDSGNNSSQQDWKKSASPAREKSVSPARSPQTHLLPQQVKPSGAKDDGESPYSPRTTRHKHSPSSRRADGGHKRAPSHDHISPSKRRRSSPGRTPQRSSDRRVSSPQKHSSVSPRRRDSPWKRGKSVSRSPVGKRGRSLSRSPIGKRGRSLSRSPVGKRGRSVSRSPVGKRGRSVSQSPVGKRGRSVSRSPSGRKAASGYKRDRHDRSRSRSPHSRDRYRRSPRRRHSPRRRSPPTGYHSRRHSPRRRPWSPPSNRSTGVGRPGKNLFVAGFSFVTTERDLEKKFSRFGRVTDVRIVRDKRSGDSRGFGFLSLERDEDADAAIRALDQTEWNGRIVLVEKSKTGR